MKKLKLFYSQLRSPVGVIHLSRTEKGIKLVALDRPEWLRQLAALRKRNELTLVRDEKRFKTVKSQLKRYFSGKNVDFNHGLDLEGATVFQKKVWKEMSKIPFGQTRSYQWLANRIKVKSPRAVGQACGSNPLPIIIPCHRVIASDGKLGGYGGGLSKKIKLLKLEGSLL